VKNKIPPKNLYFFIFLLLSDFMSYTVNLDRGTEAAQQLKDVFQQAKICGHTTFQAMINGQSKAFSVRNLTFDGGKRGSDERIGTPTRFSIVDMNGDEVKLTGRRGGRDNTFLFNEGKFNLGTQLANRFRKTENERGANIKDILKDLRNHQVRQDTTLATPSGTAAGQSTQQAGQSSTPTEEEKRQKIIARIEHTGGVKHFGAPIAQKDMTPEERENYADANESAAQLGQQLQKKRDRENSPPASPPAP
jgi:hypothetical protein